MSKSEIHQKLVISTSQALLTNMSLRDIENYPTDFLDIVKHLVPKLVEYAMSIEDNPETQQING